MKARVMRVFSNYSTSCKIAIGSLMFIVAGLLLARLGDHLSYLNSKNVVVESPFLMLGGALMALLGTLGLCVAIIRLCHK